MIYETKKTQQMMKDGFGGDLDHCQDPGFFAGSFIIAIIFELLYPLEASCVYFGLAFATPPPHVEGFSALML